MLRNEILDMMAKLKLRGMQAVLDEVLANGRKARWAIEKIIVELLKAEAAERHLRSIRYRMGHAKFPVIKDLDSFIFEESAVDENQIRSLYDGSFIESCTNLIFVGGTGTGKTHPPGDGVHLGGPLQPGLESLVRGGRLLGYLRQELVGHNTARDAVGAHQFGHGVS